MELTPRQKQILRAIVESYIQTAEPVGSKAIAAMPDMDFSSATIRNEMATLTELGLLEQPHTSAGRVPSAAGYRLYVDELMQGYRLSMDETQTLNQAMEGKLQQVDQMLSQVGKLVSQMTNLPAYAVAAPRGGVTVKRFDLILAEAHSFILVVMTSNEDVKNKLIKLPVVVTEQDLKLLSAVLNAALTGLTVEQITPEVLDRVQRSAGDAAALVPVVVDYITQVLQAEQRSEVYLTGQMRLLGQPEYRDVDKAQELLTTLDEDVISNLPALADDGPMKILVGPENVAKELKETSVVMTKFDIGDGMQGMIGVVGPTRMDYAQITARLSYFAESLGRMFGKQELPPAAPPAVPEVDEPKNS
jgi:heat-inducible transcriptional repressor